MADIRFGGISMKHMAVGLVGGAAVGVLVMFVVFYGVPMAKGLLPGC